MRPPAKSISGRWTTARRILTLSSQRKRYVRNHLMGMVYQNPRDGLNFNFTAGGNIAEKLLMAGTFNVGRMRERATCC